MAKKGNWKLVPALFGLHPRHLFPLLILICILLQLINHNCKYYKFLSLVSHPREPETQGGLGILTEVLVQRNPGNAKQAGFRLFCIQGTLRTSI